MFEFAGYQIRKANEADYERLMAWIAADADHRGRVQPEFFFKEEPGVECMVVEKDGEIKFFFRLLRALRVDIQFGPSQTKEEKAENAAVLQDGFEWLMQMAQESGFRQVTFESESRELKAFTKRRFGFKESPHELLCGIAAREAN